MKKNYLFLQGPHGPFFKELGQKLRAQGDGVLRVNFNGGDWVDWRGDDLINFTGSQEQWSRFIFKLYKKHQITDIILYGDCRSLHQVAIERAKTAGIVVHVFEEGYIRPNWITYERDGVNGNSPLMKDKEQFHQQSEQIDDIQLEHTEKVGPSTRWILLYCLRYYLFKSLLRKRFRQYILHRPYRPHQELLLWIGNILHMPLLFKRTSRRRDRLFQSGKPYYLVCLQLDSDAQLKVHSKYLSVADFTNEVLRSFAQYAPPNSMLVFKKHPFDPGAIPYETLIRLEAYSLGIRDRVMFLHSGSLPELIRQSEGVVLMNSTVGTSALHHGKPTIVLGDAIYDMPGLTCQKGLSRFWKEGSVPDQTLYRSFRSVLFKKTLVHGGFYSSQGRAFALQGILGKFEKNKAQPQPEKQLKKVIALHESYQLGFKKFIS